LGSLPGAITALSREWHCRQGRMLLVCPGEGHSPASSTSLPLQQEKEMDSWWRHRRSGYKTNIADDSISW